MISYSRGDVILVDIAFSGATGSKRRPAVVLSTNAFNRAGIKLIVAAITSNISPPYRPGDTLLDDWREAGLIKPSAVRGVLTTVDKSDVTRKLGLLSMTDLALVEQGVGQVLGFSSHPSILHESASVYALETSRYE
jgi:mRNA interferase MazF